MSEKMTPAEAFVRALHPELRQEVAHKARLLSLNAFKYELRLLRKICGPVMGLRIDALTDKDIKILQGKTPFLEIAGQDDPDDSYDPDDSDDSDDSGRAADDTADDGGSCPVVMLSKYTFSRIRFEPELLAELDQVAADLDITRHHLVNNAVREYLDTLHTAARRLARAMNLDEPGIAGLDPTGIESLL